MISPRPRRTPQRRTHSTKAIVLLACAIAGVVALNVALAAWHPWPSPSEEEPPAQDLSAQGEGEAPEEAAVPGETSSTDAPDSDVSAEREAIAVWFAQHGTAVDLDDATRIKSVPGLVTTQDGSGNDVSVPVITSYWKVGDLYLQVLDQQGQHYVDVLTETVAGVNDAAQGAGEPNVTSNASTGDAIPAGCMATLYSRLAQWAQEDGSGIVAGDAYIDDTSIASDGTVTTFDMRGPDASYQLVVVHVSYDAASDATTFSVDA